LEEKRSAETRNIEQKKVLLLGQTIQILEKIQKIQDFLAFQENEEFWQDLEELSKFLKINLNHFVA
jgi:hypothetical protein